jgi:hypothetical protein
MAKRKSARSQKPKRPKAAPALPSGDDEAKRGRGRPSALDGVNTDLFFNELEIGTPFTAAAPIAGLLRTTLYAIIKSGNRLQKEGKSGWQREFLDRFRMARAKGEAHYVKLVAAGAVGDVGAKAEQTCPECGAEIEVEVPRRPREPDTNDAKFMLKAINPKVWNTDKVQGPPGEKPISRLELVGAFQLMGQAVKQEVEDPKALLRISDRWREIYRTLGLDEAKAQIDSKQPDVKTLDQKRLSNGSEHDARAN